MKKDMKKSNEKIAKNELEFIGDVNSAWHDRSNSVQVAIVITLCSLLVAFIIWASLSEVDEITRGQGQVVAAERNQMISHLEGGILSDILVTETQTVEKEQILARVDNVAAESQLKDTRTRLWEHRIAIERLQAELEGRDPVFTEEMNQEAAQTTLAEMEIFYAHKTQLEQQTSILNSQLNQKTQELQELQSRKSTIEQSLPLARKRAELAQPMVKKNLYPEVDYLNLQQEIIRLTGELNAMSSTISKTESAIQEIEYKKELILAENKSQLVNDVNKHQSEASSLEQILNTGSDRVMRTELKSPVRGIVNRVFIYTKGGAVKAGEPIMEIVPLDGALIVEAKIRPADIAFIHPKQKAIIKLTAYDYSIYGGLEASVESISADTVTNNKNETYYNVKLVADNSSMLYKGQELPIIPGMVASVDIITGKKTIMSYLLKPILKAKDNALRER